MGYRIKTVSALTGIPKNTLVAWERRYGVLRPTRQANGYRLYSDEDIATLVQLKARIAEGLKISEAVDTLKHNALDTRVQPVLATSEEDAFLSVQEHLCAALLTFNRSKADAIVRRLINVPFETLIDNVYFPILRVVGDKWANGEVGVAQEHFASSFLRDQLVAMLLAVGCGGSSGRHVTCATFPGERHEIAALALAVRLALAGNRVTYLGADMPAADLSAFAREYEPALVCVSLIVRAEPQLVLAYARELRRGMSERTSIVIGGAGLPQLDAHVPGVTLLADWRDMNLKQ